MTTWRHKLDSELLNYFKVFAEISNAKLKDLFKHNDVIYFIVEEGELGKAIGLKGIFAKTIRNKIKKPIKIVEFSHDPIKFIKNFLLPLTVDDIQIHENTILIIVLDKFMKAKILGRKKQNLNLMKTLIKRYYNNAYDIYVQ